MRSLAFAALLVTLPASSALAAERPDASFSYSPEDPRAGQPVRFTSSSCDPDGRLRDQAWDLDGDGGYDDARGAVASATFPGAGTFEVGLQVTARDGGTDVHRESLTIATEYAVPGPDRDPLMTPFPTVRLAGRITDDGARVGLLAVRGPVCARVAVRCEGRRKGCPRRQTKFLGRRPVAFPRFHRALGAGAKLTIRVTKDDLIGKITRFIVREDRAPRRIDRCLRPGARRGSVCPEA